jgi:hypothetical protein
MQRVGATPAPGYHHLGATTAAGWSGVLGRVEVADAEVRRDTYDFVATRFMAKAQTRDGLAWLEAGWTETGWSGEGRQRVYSYDTNRQSWVFYDEYRIRPGDRVWIYLQTEQDSERAAWQAWLWWGDKWNLLTSQELAITGRALIEQYVEVHGDVDFQVPQVRVDSVSLQDGPKGPLRYWDDDVPTSSGASTEDYCLTWETRFSSWSAGSCGLSSIQTAP